MSWLSTIAARLRSAGANPGDSAELVLQKQLLLLAMGVTTLVPMLWLLLYGLLGLQMSSAIPFGYQLLSLATLLLYLSRGNFDLFRVSQSALFLFFPFVLQWSMGNFVSSSGVVMWGLLAPVTAVLLYSARESIPWFIAYVVLIAATTLAESMAGTTMRLTPAQMRAGEIIFAVNFVAVSSLVYFLLRYAAVEGEKSRARAAEAHALLKEEQTRSERLLRNILPGSVADRLKADSGTIADGFPDVTVMFADIVNFTETAEGMSPNAIFGMLNKIFSSFDALADEYRLDKIKTIGDAYMVAGGMRDGEDGYTEGVIDMALAMRDILANDPEINERNMQIRIGIATGPVVAGVVGKRKFIYDLWGDTVNIANRITTEGAPGMIQVDVVSWRRLKDKFEFEPPRTVLLKGKGETQVYRVVGRKAESEPAGDIGKVVRLPERKNAEAG
jgi:adenylate cyclase